MMSGSMHRGSNEKAFCQLDQTHQPKVAQPTLVSVTAILSAKLTERLLPRDLPHPYLSLSQLHPECSQIQRMISFIRQEAQEKVDEIDVQTDYDFETQKQNIYNERRSVPLELSGCSCGQRRRPPV